MGQAAQSYSSDIRLSTIRFHDSLLVRSLFCILTFAILNIWTLQDWPVALTETAVWTLGGFTLLRSWRLQTPWTGGWSAAALLFAAGWGMLQVATGQTADRFSTAWAAVGWATLAVFMIAVPQVLRTAAARIQFRLAVIYFGALLALWAILQAFSGGGKILWFYESESDYPMGPFLSFDHYSTFLLLLIPFVLYEAFHNKRRSIYFGCFAALMYASILVGGSRAGSLLAALELLTVAVVLTRSYKEEGRRSAIVTAILILSVCSVVGVDRLFERVRESTVDSLHFRTEAWTAAVRMLRANLWRGIGLGLPTWVSMYPGFAVFDSGRVVNAAHSDWLQWADEGGIPFVLPLLFVAVRVTLLSFRSIWGIGAAFAFLHACIDFPLQRYPILLWVIAIAGAVEASHADLLAQPVPIAAPDYPAGGERLALAKTGESIRALLGDGKSQKSSGEKERT